jgi:hypothetical protein
VPILDEVGGIVPVNEAMPEGWGKDAERYAGHQDWNASQAR